ncbi:MAG TPA: MarR family winged helix-turn-helix transcriptional regulator [Candidatus Udaeobacter sp.]|jgi:DNA-binding MarR family transcriptional regulator
MTSKKKSQTGAAFLLSQLGAYAAETFRRKISPLGLTPPHAGILRLIANTPACNQLTLARKLRVLPSRMVVLLDDLTRRGLVERKRSAKDRRHSELVLTNKGQRTLQNLRKLAAEHDAELLVALTNREREHLMALGRKIVEQQGLTADVHPGYRTLGRSRTKEC